MEYAKKYRPNSIDQFAGTQQQQLARTLQDAVERDEVIQKILFLGNSGVGKTSLSLFYAGLLNAQVHHINCLDKSGVDFVRGLVTQFPIRSLTHPYTVYLLDEIHGWSDKAQEALLVDLENLPKHVVILATSTMPQKLAGTLKSRFRIEVLQLPEVTELKRLMLRIFHENNIHITDDVTDREKRGDQIYISPTYARDILRACDGNVRSLVTLLQKVEDGTLLVTVNSDSDSGSLTSTIYQDMANGHLKYNYNIADYNGTLIGLGYYALGILQKSNNEKSLLTARKILGLVNKGLSPALPAELAFYALLSELVL